MKKPASLMQDFKNSTDESHKKMEALPFFNALADGTLEKVSMIGQLRSLGILYGTLEKALDESPLSELAELWKCRTPKLPCVLNDLEAYSDSLRDVKSAVRASLDSAAKMRRRALENPHSLLGYLYVFEGTTLGNAFHAKDAARALGLTEDQQVTCYNVYEDRLMDNWQEFTSQVDALEWSDSQRGEAVDAAMNLFNDLYRVHEVLHPVSETDLFYCATTLNPEAGDHPVPQDIREINAAINAGNRCIEEFPYFKWRYEERGQRFSDSDNAWLAALSELSDEDAETQVRWLGRVLASRGMPCITLIRQLVLLHEELCAAVPEKTEQYAKLEAIAQTMEQEYRTLLPQEEEDRLLKEFEQTAPAQDFKKQPDGGRLFISAALDEALDRVNALSSLAEWLGNPDKFSTDWISATQKTVESVKKILAGAV